MGIAENLPPDFKFKYKFKKGRKVNKFSRKQVVPFEESKQTGVQVADYGKLSKMTDKKDVQFRQTAGSMFEHFRPEEAGVFIKEDKRLKCSKKEFEEITGKMSLDNYQRKIN